MQLRVESWVGSESYVFFRLSYELNGINSWIDHLSDEWIDLTPVEASESWVKSIQSFVKVCWFNSNKAESYPSLAPTSSSSIYPGQQFKLE